MWYLRHHARRLVRSVMRPMDPEVARKWLLRARIMYVACGVSAFSFSYYIYSKNRTIVDEYKALDPTSAHRLTRLKGDPGKVMVWRLGFGKSEYIEYDNEEYTEDYKKRAKEFELKLNEGKLKMENDSCVQTN